MPRLRKVIRDDLGHAHFTIGDDEGGVTAGGQGLFPTAPAQPKTDYALPVSRPATASTSLADLESHTGRLTAIDFSRRDTGRIRDDDLRRFVFRELDPRSATLYGTVQCARRDAAAQPFTASIRGLRVADLGHQVRQ